jgi:hypothetical protein
MNKFKLTILAAALVGFTGAAQAGGSSTALDKAMLRISADSPSGDGVSTVRNQCGGGSEGWDDAEADIKISQKGTGSEVEIEVEGAKPNTFFTVWLRIKGKGGLNSGGSPLTGGGATPLASGSELDALNAVSPWNDPAGSDTVANGFWTDEDGEGEFKAKLDFAVVGGAYPFQEITGTAHPTKDALLPNVPTAIANPADTGQSATGFLIRVISHCTDNVGHGLAPSIGSNPGREAWFQTKG